MPVNHHKHQDALRRELELIFFIAKECHYTSSKLLNEINERIFRHPTFGKLPRYSRSYLDGYRECLHKQHWNYVQWVHYSKSTNQYYTKRDDIPEAEYVRGNLTSAFRYKDDFTKRFSDEESDYRL